MLTAVVTRTGEASRSDIVLPAAGSRRTRRGSAVDEGPSPIAPEGKELAWGAGAFIVFARAHAAASCSRG